jgi:hypothetical protein
MLGIFSCTRIPCICFFVRIVAQRTVLIQICSGRLCRHKLLYWRCRQDFGFVHILLQFALDREGGGRPYFLGPGPWMTYILYCIHTCVFKFDVLRHNDTLRLLLQLCESLAE